MFGIALLLPIFQKWFRKVPITNSIKDGFSISLATIISTAPFMAYYFGYLQPISLISNIIILPIFSILFSITFILTIISLVLPFVSYLLIFINPLFEWTNWAIISIANSVKAITVININYLSIILFFVMLVFMSKFNLKKGSNKLAICSICLMTLALQIAVV